MNEVPSNCMHDNKSCYCYSCAIMAKPGMDVKDNHDSECLKGSRYGNLVVLHTEALWMAGCTLSLLWLQPGVVQ